MPFADRHGNILLGPSMFIIFLGVAHSVLLHLRKSSVQLSRELTGDYN